MTRSCGLRRRPAGTDLSGIGRPKSWFIGQEADAYAKSVVLADFQEPGDADVLNKIVSDLQNAGLSHTEAEIRRMMDELLAQAAKGVEKGTSGRE